ncbi:MAG: TatD family hydrolase [Gammaproteobacteria bacterium]|nr:TatD family hydrolase [Gammaproteobacteria bacterium]
MAGHRVVSTLIDIGVNLTHDSFDHDRAEVIARAAAAGVGRMIVTGSTVASSREALALARRFPRRLHATAGIHPHHALEFAADTAQDLVALAAHPEVVAIGECGLDYFRDLSPRADQRLAFERQLGLAAVVGKPVFLHQRDAHEDFLAILREHQGEIIGGVAHCFTGTRAQMEAYLALGLYVGITGWICDERRGTDLRDAVTGLPLDRLLIETDAPYLLPRTLGSRTTSRRNEPAFLPEVLGMVARCMKATAADVAVASTRNAERLFGLEPEPRS